MRRFTGARLILAAGLAVFISAKMFFILVQAAAMGMPRLGDDAFTHLWRAAQFERVGFFGALRGDGDAAYRGSHDIAALCETDKLTSPSSHALCARVDDNTAGADVKAGASALLYASLQTGLSWKRSYALFEIIIAVTLGLCVAYFLSRLVGPAATGLSLIFLSFMTLLPPQGLNQFVASTLAIALSLALWGLVIRRQSPYLYAAALAGAGALSLIHPVALVYGGGLVLLAIFAFRKELTPGRLAIMAAAAVAVLLALLLVANPVREVLAEAMSEDLWAVAIANFAAIPDRAAGFALKNAGVLAAIVIGLFFARRAVDDWFLAVAATLFLLLTVSLFYHMEFFTFAVPLDLFARVFNGMAVLGCGLIGAVLVKLWQDGSRLRQGFVVAAIPLLCVPSFLSWHNSIYDNINNRGEVINQQALQSALKGVQPYGALAYGELEISPTAAFLAGGGDRGAIPMMALSPETLDSTLNERRPSAFVLPNYHSLNILSYARIRSLEPRRYGFPADLIDTITIRTPNAPIVMLYVHVENDGDEPATIGPIRYVSDNGQQQWLSNLTVPPQSSAWVPLHIGEFPPARTVLFNLPLSDAWITGFAVNDPPRDGVNWPWRARALVTWQRRDQPRGTRTSALRFSPAELFAYWNRRSVPRTVLSHTSGIISDASGLVFFATNYDSKP